MKTPESTSALYQIIKSMEHRERACFALNGVTRNRIANSYSLEVYVTYPFSSASCFDKADQHRVLFSIVTADGKVCDRHKISVGRKFLSPESKQIQKVFGMITGDSAQNA